MVVILLGLLMGSILTYRYFFISRLLEGGTLFHCNVIYSNGFTSDRMEFAEAVRILREQRGQFISVPVPTFRKGDAADIVHDFRKNLTAYWDKELDNCYISELDTAHVPPPENLLDLLSKVEKGMYFPHSYMIREELVVIGRTKNLGSPIIDEMCHNKDTYLLAKRRKSSRASRKRRSREDCRIIHHFESPYLMETVICS
ncbi:integral membrane protein 2C-like [Stigmatopora nigra]